MELRRYAAGPLGVNCYLLVNAKTKHAIIVDPGGCPRELTQYVKENQIIVEAVLLTHAHFDHILGIDDVIRNFGEMPVYIHEKDQEYLKNPQLNLSGLQGMSYRYDKGTVVVDGQLLEHAGFQFKVLHTPGHTPGGVCYYVEKEGIMFSGDTLFAESVGRTDFPGGSMLELVGAIRGKLFTLPEETNVFPGHMGYTTIDHEKVHNYYA